MALCFGIHLSPSFLEATLSHLGDPLPREFTRHFLGQTNIPEVFRKMRLSPMASPVGDFPNAKFILAYNHLEKIFHSRIGSSVAQICPKGFKDLFELRIPRGGSSSLWGSHQDVGLESGTKEHCYEMDYETGPETDSADDMALIDAIAAKAYKIVCLQSFAKHEGNPKLENLRKKLEERNIRVLWSTPKQGMDEILTWRKQVFAASLISAFEENLTLLKNETSNFKTSENVLEKINLSFIANDGRLVSPDDIQNNPSILAGLHLGALSAVRRSHGDHKGPILYLGHDKWVIMGVGSSSAMASPWGEIDVIHEKHSKLQIQPTSFLNSSDPVVSSEWGGFEPGPVVFGKSLRPLVYDALALAEINSVENQGDPWMTDGGKSKATQLLGQWSREKGQDVRDYVKNIMDQVCFQVGMECVDQWGSSERILCTGSMAKQIFPGLLKTWGKLPWRLSPQAEIGVLKSIPFWDQSSFERVKP
jgi:hypothetical protein